MVVKCGRGLAVACLFVSVLAGPALADNYDDAIRKMCAARWADNFDMQAFCVDKQQAALQKFVKRAIRDKSDPLYQASVNCFGKWTEDGGITDWDMVNFCIDKQEEGYRKLNGG